MSYGGSLSQVGGHMPILKLFEDYEREEIHDIFAPGTPFKPSRGAWGNHGIARIPGRPGDWVFMVSFGRTQGEHDFDEGINSTGLFRWQSQPRQGLKEKRVNEWINHDEDRNTIYLFLRTAITRRGQRLPYTYLGRLKYVDHDAEREKPVHFLWQLLDWPIDQAAIDRMELEFDDELPSDEGTGRAETSAGADTREHKPGLTRVAAPKQKPGKTRQGATTQSFRARKYGDRSKADAANRALGKAGELLVVEYERQALLEAGRQDLADKVLHVAQVEGDGAGYDVKSFELNGVEKHIEVKTTDGPRETPFFLSANELRRSQELPNSFYLYRVFNYRPDSNSGQFYVVRGAVSEVFELSPTQYRVSNLNSDVNVSDFGG